jgi:hypothetical protein
MYMIINVRVYAGKRLLVSKSGVIYNYSLQSLRRKPGGFGEEKQWKRN